MKEFDGWENDEIEPIPCPYCENRGYRVLLGPKILMPGEPMPADYENCLECPTCYAVIPIYETAPTEEIKDQIEKIESPFESGKFHSESIPKRSSPAGKKLTSKRRRNKIKPDDDPEIDSLLKIYGDRVNILK